MPLLQKQAPRLLRNIGGKPHATQKDHHDPLPTPPQSNSTRSSGPQAKHLETEEDIYADPKSDSDDEQKSATFRLPSRISASSSQDSSSGVGRLQLDGSGDVTNGNSAFRRPTGISPASTASKRSAASEPTSSDSECIFASQGSPKKRRKYIQPGPTVNIHANPTAVRIPRFGQEKTYVRRRSTQEGPKQTFKHPKKLKEDPKPKITGAVFKKPTASIDTGSHAEERSFQLPGRAEGVLLGAADPEGFSSRSPSLSSLSSPPSSPGVEEIAALDLPVAGLYLPTVECTICGSQVARLLKEQFEDEHSQSEHLSYKSQRRFCWYHKQHAAREIWEERGYPEIDWDGFRARLQKRKHMTYLECIISGEHGSVYRQQLEDTLNKGRNKSLRQAARDTDDKKRTSVGYYGPRGEKLL